MAVSWSEQATVKKQAWEEKLDDHDFHHGTSMVLEFWDILERAEKSILQPNIHYKEVPPKSGVHEYIDSSSSYVFYFRSTANPPNIEIITFFVPGEDNAYRRDKR